MIVALLTTIVIPRNGNRMKATVFPAGTILSKNNDSMFQSPGHDVEIELSEGDYFVIPQCIHSKYTSGCSQCLAEVNAELRARSLYIEATARPAPAGTNEADDEAR